MLIVGYRTILYRAAYNCEPRPRWNGFYKAVQAQTRMAPVVAAQAREELAKLQETNPENLALWQEFITALCQALERVYARLKCRILIIGFGQSFLLVLTLALMLVRGTAKSRAGAAKCIFLTMTQS